MYNKLKTSHLFSSLQHHHHPHTEQEVTEAFKSLWNQDGPCRVVVLHLSLLIHCCIDCVFIWRGNGGELMSEASYISQRFLLLLSCFFIWQGADVQEKDAWCFDMSVWKTQEKKTWRDAKDVLMRHEIRIILTIMFYNGIQKVPESCYINSQIA